VVAVEVAVVIMVVAVVVVVSAGCGGRWWRWWRQCWSHNEFDECALKKHTLVLHHTTSCASCLAP
jgi:hypothetical protein